MSPYQCTLIFCLPCSSGWHETACERKMPQTFLRGSISRGACKATWFLSWRWASSQVPSDEPTRRSWRPNCNSHTCNDSTRRSWRPNCNSHTAAGVHTWWGNAKEESLKEEVNCLVGLLQLQWNSSSSIHTPAFNFLDCCVGCSNIGTFGKRQTDSFTITFYSGFTLKSDFSWIQAASWQMDSFQ